MYELYNWVLQNLELIVSILIFKQIIFRFLNKIFYIN